MFNKRGLPQQKLKEMVKDQLCGDSNFLPRDAQAVELCFDIRGIFSSLKNRGCQCKLSSFFESNSWWGWSNTRGCSTGGTGRPTSRQKGCAHENLPIGGLVLVKRLPRIHSPGLRDPNAGLVA